MPVAPLACMSFRGWCPLVQGLMHEVPQTATRLSSRALGGLLPIRAQQAMDPGSQLSASAQPAWRR